MRSDTGVVRMSIILKAWMDTTSQTANKWLHVNILLNV